MSKPKTNFRKDFYSSDNRWNRKGGRGRFISHDAMVMQAGLERFIRSKINDLQMSLYNYANNRIESIGNGLPYYTGNLKDSVAITVFGGDALLGSFFNEPTANKPQHFKEQKHIWGEEERESQVADIEAMYDSPDTTMAVLTVGVPYAGVLDSYGAIQSGLHQGCITDMTETFYDEVSSLGNNALIEGNIDDEFKLSTEGSVRF